MLGGGRSVESLSKADGTYRPYSYERNKTYIHRRVRETSTGDLDFRDAEVSPVASGVPAYPEIPRPAATPLLNKDG
jgi:hypothetical protein